VFDHLDFVHALNAYLDGFGASTYAIRKGFHDLGVEDNSVLIFSELMGSESVFLTANADTVYYLSVVDLTPGPMVVETPPQALVRRHVVGVEHRLRPAGAGSRRRRPFHSSRPAMTAGCRTAATTSDTRARRGRSCSAGRS
jgi:hypothetical protein